METFENIKLFLQNHTDKLIFDKFIQPLAFIAINNEFVFLGSADKNKYDWIKRNLLNEINNKLKSDLNVKMILVPLFDDLNDPDESPQPNNDINTVEPVFLNHEPTFQNNLIKKHTFDSFVQLESNKMAYSFAHSVSEFPGKSYNPLYIHSDVGLGKTHLMSAIGNRITDMNKSMKVLYLTTRDFMTEYVEYTRLNKRSEFLKKFITIDVLLIDDIQFITKWGGTKEQFYYVFNKLIEMEKQIVIASDKHPENIPDLDSRIKSRFEWGALTDILPPDLEGRIAILKEKIKERAHLIKNQFIIPDDVVYFLASSVKDNIRRLEGALNRLIGYANLKFPDIQNNVISLPFAKEALKPYISLGKDKVTLDSIQEFIAKKYNLTVLDLKSKNNSRYISWPRQIAMYLSKKLTNCPLSEIGEKFGGKHHTTVLHSIKKVEDELEVNKEFLNQIESYSTFFEQ